MNDYTNEYIKKEAERESLAYFQDAYKDVTGEALEVLEEFERPDFICLREDGSRVGIELTKIRRGHPDIILFDRILMKQDHMSIDDALDMLQIQAVEKEKKRNEPDWKHRDAAILLIELSDIPLAEIEGLISREYVPDLYSTGFEEVWLADFTGLEAYGNVELFCVQPHKWMGYHQRPCQKPYG